MEQYLLYGSGGHAKVVLECLLSEGKEVVGFFDDTPKNKLFKGIPVFERYDAHTFAEAKIIVTIGNNEIREKIVQKVAQTFGKAIYYNNIISPDSQIGHGSMVLQGVIVHADARIGSHVILNTRSVVEHDCLIEDFVHIAPGAVVCGHAHIGKGTLVGANAAIAPFVKIGQWCQIAAGSSVTEDIPDFSLVAGVPGKVVKSLRKE